MNENNTPTILSDAVKIELIHSIKEVLIRFIEVTFQNQK